MKFKYYSSLQKIILKFLILIMYSDIIKNVNLRIKKDYKYVAFIY